MTLEVAAPAQLPAYGDRDLVQQAVANLVDNAVKFSPPEGWSGCAPPPARPGWKSSWPTKARASRPPTATRAIERFFRGEAARSTPGAGLGLALVQAVAQLHQGSLLLDDAAPGVRAVLTLPAPEDAAGGS